MKNILLLFLSLCLLFSCKNKADKEIKQTRTKQETPQTAKIDSSELSLLSKQIFTALKEKDYEAFASYFHPIEGLRFSPYSLVDTAGNIRLTADKFLDLLPQKDKKMVWGSYDGSGKPIRLTVHKYLQTFVYDVDFLNAPQFSVNKLLKTGNSLNNIAEMYPNLPFTESYFPGFDKQYEGMDWKNIKLVFKKFKGDYYLVGIIHDQWTI